MRTDPLQNEFTFHNSRTDPFMQPPGYTGDGDCSSFIAGAKAAGATSPDKCGNCSPGTHKIRLWSNSTLGDPHYGDFHYYRQDSNGTWSDKPGNSSAEPVPDPNTYHKNYKLCGDLCTANTSLTH